MAHAILLDFGSTFTKVTVVDLKKRKIILTDKTPSTVHRDAMVGMNRCMDSVRRVLTEQEIREALKLASSSAAGGLKVAVVGLTRGLSLTAGRGAVFGAGAKILGSFWGVLQDEDIRKLEEMNLEILFFCGGYENGNETMLLQNAEKLAFSNLHIPIVYSGNQKAAGRIRQLMIMGHKECFLVDNILPSVGVMNAEPSQKVVRDLFMKRITNMKGLGEIKRGLDGMILPTPAAVLQAGELLSRGTENQKGMGSFLMADVGGATTDIYSFALNKTAEGAATAGVEEPYARRTVEGDMGMRESAICLLEATDPEVLAEEAGTDREDFIQALKHRAQNIDYIADSEKEYRIDQTIAKWAVKISARRHAGRLEDVCRGEIRSLQRGKNLTEVTRVIGTGGVLVNSKCPGKILSQVLRDCRKEQNILLPESAETYIDSQYVLYAAGLLKDFDREAAMEIMKQSIRQTERGEDRDGYTDETPV